MCEGGVCLGGVCVGGCASAHVRFAWFLVVPLNVILPGFVCPYSTCWGWVNSLSVGYNLQPHYPNRNQKQPERFPEEQLTHANMRLLILIWVVMTFPQLPLWPESLFLTLPQPHYLEDVDLFSYLQSPEKNHERVLMLYCSQMLDIGRKCHLKLSLTKNITK